MTNVDVPGIGHNQHKEDTVSFDPEQPMTVQNFFSNIADTIVNASKLAKEVAELRRVVAELKSDVEMYRERNARLDEEVHRLRAEREDNRGQIIALIDQLESTKAEHGHAITRLDTTQRELADWQHSYNNELETRRRAEQERDDTKMEVLSLTDRVEALQRELEATKSRADKAEETVANVKQALEGVRRAFVPALVHDAEKQEVVPTGTNG